MFTASCKKRLKTNDTEYRFFDVGTRDNIEQFQERNRPSWLDFVKSPAIHSEGEQARQMQIQANIR